MKSKIKIKIIISIAVFAFSVVLVGFAMHSNEKEKEGVSIDFDAFMPSGQGSQMKQFLLKMELVNSKEDVLKFGLNTPEEHQERLSYYFKDFKRDIFLVTDEDTLTCIDAHIERTYMDAPKRNFILNFHLEKDQEIQKLLIADQVYSGQLLELNIRK